MDAPKKRGRRPGTLLRATCSACGVVLMARGTSNVFKCGDCRYTYRQDVLGIRGSGTSPAMAMVSLAIRDGNLKRAQEFKCMDCPRQAECYDHRDYNFPLMVDPVCQSCNLRRGPGRPRVGFFSWMFAGKWAYYSRGRSMHRVLSLVGIETNLDDFPKRVDMEDWLPFKERLLEWEREYGKKLKQAAPTGGVAA